MQIMKLVTRFSLLVVVCQVGCSTIPTSGPTRSQLIDQATKQGPTNFALVEVDPHVIMALSAEPAENFAARLKDDGKPAGPKIGIGDTVSITIWDSANGSIFGPQAPEATPGALSAAPGGATRNVTLPEQQVAPDGAISVPYAGRVPALNQTPLEVQLTIQRRLAKTSFEPQVIVTVTKSISQSVTVSGEAMAGTRVPLSVRGDRLLDVIAAAGGTKTAPYETAVRLTRHGVSVTIPMQSLVSDPSTNVYALPGDIITLVRQPQTFSVFGATVNNALIPFGADHINLAQAIAKAGGLQDARADPAGVFLFRFEPSSVIAALGQPTPATALADQTPVVYHLNIREAEGFFLARRFPMRDDDMIYVANASMTELQKFFTLIGTISAPLIQGVVVGRAAAQ